MPAVAASLAGLLLCPATPELASHAGWRGPGVQNRPAVVSKVQEALQAPDMMLPEARLEALVEQALAAQVHRGYNIKWGYGSKLLSWGTAGCPVEK